jgi:hypothetical protein
LFFPLFSFLRMRKQKGERWAKIVETVNELPLNDPRVIAFRLTVDRVRRMQNKMDTTCRDRFCATCISDLIAGFPGTEQDLISFYNQNLDEVNFEVRAMRSRAAARRKDAAGQTA